MGNKTKYMHSCEILNQLLLRHMHINYITIALSRVKYQEIKRKTYIYKI